MYFVIVNSLKTNICLDLLTDTSNDVIKSTRPRVMVVKGIIGDPDLDLDPYPAVP